MNPFNILFYIVLFLGLFLPTNVHYYFPIFGVMIGIREVAFILLPVINIFCFSKRSVTINNKKISRLIIFFFSAVLFAELLKILIYNETIAQIVKTLRMGIPLYASLIIMKQGIRADITKVWKVLLSAISISCLIGFLSMFVPLPIYTKSIDYANSLIGNSGRLFNDNSAFGVIGLYLFFQDRNEWYNNGKLVRITCILSLIALILGFNRTYLTLIFIFFVYLFFKNFRFNRIFKFLSIPILILAVFLSSYNIFPSIQRQVNKRFFSIANNKTSFKKSTIEGNRDQIYEGILEKFKKGYWIIGIPYNKGIFMVYKEKEGQLKIHNTDISLVNVVIINGILALIIFIMLFLTLIKIEFLPVILIVIYGLASLNIDALYNHNSILFIILFGFVYQSSKVLNKEGITKDTEHNNQLTIDK